MTLHEKGTQPDSNSRRPKERLPSGRQRVNTEPVAAPETDTAAVEPLHKGGWLRRFGLFLTRVAYLLGLIGLAAFALPYAAALLPAVPWFTAAAVYCVHAGVIAPGCFSPLPWWLRDGCWAARGRNVGFTSLDVRSV
jgi:hypothetical protein